MSYTPLNKAVEAYKEGSVTLEQAAANGSVDAEDLESELRSQGVEIRGSDSELATSTRY